MNKEKPLNVLLLTIDALRADRTSLLGYNRPTTPNLERLAKNAIVCEQAVSLSTFTQSACLQLLTSTRPLSCGGYDHGAKGRPDTLFKQLNDHGYRTTNLTSLHWVNKYYGYGPGVDEEVPLFGLNTFPGVVIVMLRNTLIAYEQGDIDEAAMMSEAGPMMKKFFADVTDFCRWQINHADEIRKGFPDSSLVNADYDYLRVLKLLERHNTSFQNDPVAYVCRHLVPTTKASDWAGQWLMREWFYMRRPWRLISEAAHRASSWVLRHVAPDLSKARDNRFKSYADASSLADRVIRSLEEHDHKQPFCIWTHFMDTHTPYVSGAGRNWYKQTPDYLKALGYAARYAPAMTFDTRPQRAEDHEGFSALYDAAVLSTDTEIGRVIDALDRLGLREKTLVAISGDHGEELGEHGSWGHLFLLYEHNTRVPMIFHHPSIAETRIDAQVSTMDFAPTITKILGIDPVKDWEGSAITGDSDKEDLMLMETFFGGNCLFEQRPLYFAVRSHELLYMWKEYLDPSDKISPPGPELYNHSSDPAQRNNIYRDNHPELSLFNSKIAERMAEIPEVSDQRIVDAFGEIGQAAVTQVRGSKSKL